MLLSAGHEWSRSYRVTNQHPNLPWNFVTHGLLDPSAFPEKSRLDVGMLINVQFFVHHRRFFVFSCSSSWRGAPTPPKKSGRPYPPPNSLLGGPDSLVEDNFSVSLGGSQTSPPRCLGSRKGTKRRIKLYHIKLCPVTPITGLAGRVPTQKNIYVPWVPKVAHKSVTPGHGQATQSELPAPPDGHRPKRFAPWHETNT